MYFFLLLYYCIFSLRLLFTFTRLVATRRISCEILFATSTHSTLNRIAHRHYWSLWFFLFICSFTRTFFLKFILTLTTKKFEWKIDSRCDLSAWIGWLFYTVPQQFKWSSESLPYFFRFSALSSLSIRFDGITRTHKIGSNWWTEKNKLLYFDWFREEIECSRQRQCSIFLFSSPYFLCLPLEFSEKIHMIVFLWYWCKIRCK